MGVSRSRRSRRAVTATTIDEAAENPPAARLDARRTFADYYAAINALDEQFARLMAQLASRQERRRPWSLDNRHPTHRDDELVERHYVALWTDHGVDPLDASYAYVVLPGATRDEVRDYADDPGVEIVESTSDVHALRSGGILGANFWSDRPSTVSRATTGHLYSSITTAPSCTSPSAIPRNSTTASSHSRSTGPSPR